MRVLLCASLLCLSAVLSAQELYSSTIDTPQVASETLSEKLDNMARTLEQALNDSVTDWDILSTFLTGLSSKLDESVTLSRDLEQETKSMEKSLEDLETSLDSTQTLVRSHKLQLNIWRTAAFAAVSACLGAVADEDSHMRGIAYGAAVGAICGGSVWLLSVRLP